MNIKFVLRRYCSTIFFIFLNHFPFLIRSCIPLTVCVMQVHHGVMPSHTMYALNMERILCRIWHPSHEELEQDRVHRQRIAAKDGVLVS